MSVSTWVRDETFRRRHEFRNYITGLIRYEIQKGEDNPHRLEVLGKIYYDLLYEEDLTGVEGWKKGKVEDDLLTYLDKIQKLTHELEKYKTTVDEISNVAKTSKGKSMEKVLEIIENLK